MPVRFYLTTAAIASLLPDLDTSKSLIGRLFFPLSRWLESHAVHRGITHSFSEDAPNYLLRAYIIQTVLKQV